ncbi:hypothetical protein CR513_53977, partial [Mucuna pruriens]
MLQVEELMDKTPAAARHLISNMASNTQQFRIRGVDPSWMVNEIGIVDNLRLENQLTELTSLIRQLVVRQHQPSIVARVCGICTSVERPTYMCLTLQEIESNHPKSVGAIGDYQYGKQPYQSQQFDNKQFGRKQFQPSSSQGPYVAQRFGSTPSVLPNQSAESTISGTTVPIIATTESTLSRKLTIFGGPDEFQQNMSATIQDLKTQIGQLANILAGSEKLPSQTILNPRGNASVVSLRSRRELPQVDSELDADSQVPQKDKSVPLSFPTWILSGRKPESDEELLNMFRKVEINIPLLDAIKQIPKYTKFLKELCVHKRKR